MRKTCIIFAVAAVLLLWVGTAQAASYGTVKATWGGVDPDCETHYVNSPCNDGTIYVGMYWLNNVTLTSGAIPGVPTVPSTLPIYCVDTYQWANTGTTTYSVNDLADAPSGNGAPAMGATKAAYLKNLIYNHFSASASDADKAVFAACVWEIVYEPISSWDVTTGNVTVALTAAEKITAASWLGSVSTYDHENTAYALISENAQDFAISFNGGHENPVPEPLTMLAFGSALAGLAGYIRKHRRLAPA
jgi:hypothetical protein